MAKRIGVLPLAGLAAAVAVAFLLSPVPSRPVVCAQDVRLARGLGFPLNCDSRVFVGLAARPDALFDAGGSGRTWQSRPLFVAAGALARAWCRTVVDAVGWRPRVADVEFAAWMGYVLVNFFLLTAAMAVFAAMLRPWALPGVLLLALASFLAANRVVKGFFWTPHTQIFNVLVPVLAIAWASGERSIGRPAVRMLAAGLLSLAYGGFLVLGAALALAAALRASSGREAARRFVAGLALLAIPPAVWVGLVRLATGSFYSYETRFYHEFVWAAEALRRGAAPFGEALAGHLGRFAVVAAPVVAVPGAAVAAIVIAARSRGLRVADLSADARRLLAACGIFLAVGVPFFALLGYYADRLAWNFVPPLLVATIVVAAEMRRLGRLSTRAFALAACAAAAVNLALLVARPNA